MTLWSDNITTEIINHTAAVIPAYNAERHLAAIVEDTSRFIPRRQIVVVDDGSTDRTNKIASGLGILLITHERNKGKGAALLTGIEAALDLGMNFVITLDADGQHNPKEIPKFIEAEKETGADIIIGNRMHNTRKMPFIRIFSNRATSFMISLRTGIRIPDSQNGYRLLKTELFRKLKIITTKYDTESEVIIKSARLGARIESVPVETIYAGEKSSINPFIDSCRFLRMVIRSFFW